jgi:hypothetical protein
LGRGRGGEDGRQCDELPTFRGLQSYLLRSGKN